MGFFAIAIFIYLIDIYMDKTRHVKAPHPPGDGKVDEKGGAKV
jgi:hypothetical protein